MSETRVDQQIAALEARRRELPRGCAERIELVERLAKLDRERIAARQNPPVRFPNEPDDGPGWDFDAVESNRYWVGEKDHEEQLDADALDALEAAGYSRDSRRPLAGHV